MLTLSPQLFEDAVAQVLRVRFGWDTHRTPYSGDGGWDVEVRASDGRFLLVECKQFSPSKAVGRPVLQKLHSAMITESADRGIVVTTSSFSGPAEDFAKKTGIQLIDGEALSKLMREAYPSEAKADVTYNMCTRCGQIVEFEASSKPAKKTCPNGHLVPDAMANALQRAEHRARIQQYKFSNIEDGFVGHRCLGSRKRRRYWDKQDNKWPNKPIAPYCCPLAVLAEPEKSRLGSGR